MSSPDRVRNVVRLWLAFMVRLSWPGSATDDSKSEVLFERWYF